jgi:hypothetical protein
MSKEGSLMLTIPQDYARRWYVVDAIADAVEAFIKRTPDAAPAELQRVAEIALRETFRAEHKIEGPLSVYA